jgi:hypothetical protein
MQHELSQAGRMSQGQLPWICPLGGTWMTSKGCLKMKGIELAEMQAAVARKFSITTDQIR